MPGEINNLLGIHEGRIILGLHKRLSLSIAAARALAEQKKKEKAKETKKVSILKKIFKKGK